MPQNNSNSIAKNGLYYTASTFVCMVIPLVFYPYITRVLGPEYFGRISFVHTLISYFVILSTLGINNYAQKICSINGEDVTKLSKAVYEILWIAGFLTTIACVLYVAVVFLIDIEAYDYPLYFISIGLILFSSLRMDWLLVAKEEFFFTAFRDVFSKGLLLVGCFTLIKDKDDLLLFGFLYVIAYAVLPAVLNYTYISKKKIIRRVDHNNIELKHHFEPIFFLSLVTIGSKIFSSADILMIRFLKGESDVGIYNNAIKLPLVIDELLMAIAAVVTPRLYLAVSKKNEKEIYHLVGMASNSMFFFAIPAIITCVFYSRELVQLLGGDEYVSGGEILIVYSFIMLTTLCLTIAGTRVFIARGMEKQLFLSLLVAGVLNIGLNAIMIPQIGALGAAVSSVLSNMALLLFELWYAHTFKYLFTMDKVKYLIAGAVLSIVFIIIRTVMSEIGFFELAMSIVIGGIGYVSVLYILKECTLMKIILVLKKRLKKG